MNYIKLFLPLFIVFTSLTGFSQKKYQGLLWEISGNGLTESSYLYGTMHVSNKLAFNVSDSFYICLSKAQGIALESSPAAWMEEYRDMGAFSGGGYDFGSDFYSKAFKVKEPKTEVIFDLLENKNGLMNQILYRFNPGNEDYQENTFLDMFIFQAGAKNEKPIFSLEELDEVMKLSVKSMTPDKEKERDNSNNNYLEKDGQQKFVQLEEAYRRGDLDKIDSLSKSDTPTQVYHKYFIVERNKNMVRRMDSLMRIQSLFTGIGAAHLPGDEGAIQLLRDMGYKVRPVNVKSTGKSHKMRKKFENTYRPIKFSPTKTTDGFVTVSTPGELFEMPTNKRGKMEYLCPEPVNGGYFSIIRLFTYGPIFNKTPEYYKSTFDSLLYIATPGEMMKKEEITVNGHIGYNILTKTSKNAFVNYNVIFSPTEILVFKGSGIDTYIQKTEPQSFFTKIELSPNSSEWTKVSPKFGGAKWKMKGMVSGQDMIKGMDETIIDPMFQSYDNTTKEYFQVMRYSYNDLDYIEEDSFDLTYLGKIYGKELGYDVDQSEFTAKSGYSYVDQTLKRKEERKNQVEELKVRIFTQGGLYYLMSTTASKDNASTFFNSFEFTDFIIDNEYEEYVDTTLHYSASTLKVDEKPDYNAMYAGLGGYKDDDEEDKSHLGATETKMHYSTKSNESIYVGYSKFHDYDGADSLQDFWDYRKERLADENQMLVTREVEKEIEGDKTLSFVLTDTGSSKGIMTLLHLHHGVLYTVQTLIDTVKGPSKYAQTFFDTFKPSDTLIGRDIFEDKAQVWYDHIFSEDSLNKVNAIKSIRNIDFTENDIDKIAKVYTEYEFDEDTEISDREKLIMSLGNVEHQDAYDFLNGVYDTNNFKSDLQFIVLKCFSYTETKEAYDAIENQLLNNTPFTENDQKLNFFNNLYDSLELAKSYFPKMLELSQYPEYKPYVVELLSYGYQEEIFSFSDFSSEKSSIFRNANIELKRTVANQESDKKQNNYYFGGTSQTAAYHNLFLDYYALMCGFKKNGDKDVNQFFDEIHRIKNKKFLVEAEIIHHKLGMPVDTAKINEVTADLEYQIWAYNRLDKNDMLDYFTPSITQEDMAFASLYNYGYDEEEDTAFFVKKVLIDNGSDLGYIYFFKRKTKKNKNYMIDYVGLQPVDEKEFKTLDLETKKGLSVRNDEEMELTIDKTIEIFEMSNRKRVVLTSFNWGGWGGLF
ncbi:MAG: TraB/GumN family protein [Crocinitomicaceae bacterium]